MNISEVEHIVHLSKKSIRFYEENGLLNPKRNRNNDYRIYDEKDIKKLKIIKFLRELDVSIHEIKMLQDGVVSLKDCMKERILKIEEEQEKYEKIKSMCLDILEKDDTLESLEVTNHFVGMNVLNKEGFTMRNTKTNKRKKIIGAILSSLIFSFLFLSLIGMISYFQFTNADKLPWLIYIFFVLFFCIPVYGIGYNLIIRMKEINGGEEDEASKY